MKRATVVALASLGSALAAPVRADEPPPSAPRAELGAPAPNLRAEAKALAERGDAQFDAGRCDKAIALWKMADVRFQAPTIKLRIARCQALLGRVVAAAVTLEAISHERVDPASPWVFMEAKRAAERELSEVRVRIATLKISLNKPSGVTATPTIEIDEAVFSSEKEAIVPMDPGTHVVRVRGPEVLWERKVTLTDGEVRGYNLSLWSEPRVSSLRAEQKIGLALGGVGVAAIGVGIGFAAAALSTSQRIVEACDRAAGQCPASGRALIDRYGLYSQVADFSLIGGGALLATSAIALFALRHHSSAPPLLRVSASAWPARRAVASSVSPGFGVWIAGAY